MNDLAAKFKDKYGITLEVVRGIDSELIPKVDAENQTGKNVADVFAFASAQWGVDNAAKGMFVAPAGPAFDDPAYNKASNVSADGTQFISTAAVFGYAWNTDRYSNGMKGYADALDPELAGGKVGVIDVHTSTVLVDFYQYLEAQMGPDYLTKLAAQKPKIYPSGLPMAQALTSGEIAATVYAGPLVDEKAKGAPVDFGLPDKVWGARFNTVDPEGGTASQRGAGPRRLHDHPGGSGGVGPQVGVGAAEHHRGGHHGRQGGQAGPDEADARRGGRLPGEVGRDVQVVGGSRWVIRLP